jgi:hypothetical protein
MQRCAFCGSEFPDNARFCGQCGRAPVATLDAPTTLSSAQARPVPKKGSRGGRGTATPRLPARPAVFPRRGKPTRRRTGAGSPGDAADERRAGGARDTADERRTRSLSRLVERCPACSITIRATTGSTEWSTDGSSSSTREACAGGVAAPTARASPPRATRAATVWKAPCPPFRRVCSCAGARVCAQGASHRARRPHAHCGRWHYSGSDTQKWRWDTASAWHDHLVLPSYCR